MAEIPDSRHAQELEDHVVFEALRGGYYDDAATTVITTWILPFALWLAIGSSVDLGRFIIWSLLLAGVTTPLLVLRRLSPERQRWLSVALFFECLCGCAWGSLMLIAPPSSLLHQMFVAVIVVAAAMGAAIAMGQFVSLYVAFATMTVVTASIGFWVNAPDIALAISMLFAVLLVFSTSVASENSKGHRRLATALHRNEVMANDLAEQNEALQTANDRLDSLARTDALTGLDNRRSFDLALRKEMRALVEGENVEVTLAYMDLDGFKGVNDEHGHRVGDKLLQVFAERLRRTGRDGEHTARIGGDEFVLLSREAPDEIGDRLVDHLMMPMVVDGINVDVGVSIGIARTSKPIDPEVLIRRADIGLYDAKSAGGQRFLVNNDPSESVNGSGVAERAR